VRALFWISAALLAWAQVGYGLFLAALRRLGAPEFSPPSPNGVRPRVSLIVAAYREESVIAEKVANALALDWPRDRLELIVAVDGGGEPGADFTAQRARAAGADVVLELPRMGKYRAQDTAVGQASGDLSRSPTPMPCGIATRSPISLPRSATRRSATRAARSAS